MATTKKSTETNANLKKRIKDLEDENMRLKKDNKKPNKSNKTPNFWLRNLPSALLIFMASVMLVSSIMFIWLQRTIIDEDTWVKNTTEIIEVKAVQDDVSNKITDQLFSQVNIDQYVKDVLPERAAPLALPISAGIEGFVRDKTKEVVSSDKFAEVWIEANRLSHESLVNSIVRLNEVNSNNNTSDVLFIKDESLMLNLRPILDQVKQEVVARGITFLPEQPVVSQERVTFRIAEINNLPTILGAYNLLNSLSYWLPILAVVFGAAGIFLATNRRRAFVGVVIVSIVLAVAVVQLIKAGQYATSQSVTNSAQAVSVESATAIYKIITVDLITSMRYLMGGLLIIGVFLFLTGPSAAAKWLRSKVGSLAKNYKDNSKFKFVAKNAHTIVGVVAIIVAGLIVLVPFSSPWFAIWMIVIGGLISVGLIALKQELES